MRPLLKFAMRWIIRKDYHLIGLFACAALIGGAAAFTTSFLSNTNVLLGLCLIPFCLFLSQGRKFNYTYLCLTLVFGIVAYSYGVRAFYFFMLGFYGLFLIELYFGKVNSLVVFLLAFGAPLFHQVSVILGFPIRLKLSEWAGAMILAAGRNIKVEGNMMTMDGNAFTVDDACMGLSMLSTSLLMGVAVIAHQYRVTGLRLNFSQLFVFFSAVFVLNIASNLLRIVLLVLFHILPDDPMHDVIGILCLVLYVVVPLYFLSKLGISRYGRTCDSATSEVAPVRTFPKIVLAVLATIVVVTGVHIDSRRNSSHEVAHVSAELPGTIVEKMDQGITKLYNEEILVYLKPIPEFFTSEHTPLLCWKGSGFEFESVRKTMAAGHEIYIGRLKKPGEVLFTAWWYNNGNVTTVEQWDWRVRMLRGEKRFCLVNVTAKDESLLMSRVEEMIRNDWMAVR